MLSVLVNHSCLPKNIFAWITPLPTEAQIALITAHRRSALLGLMSVRLLLVILHGLSMESGSGRFAVQSSMISASPSARRALKPPGRRLHRLWTWWSTVENVILDLKQPGFCACWPLLQNKIHIWPFSDFRPVHFLFDTVQDLCYSQVI